MDQPEKDFQIPVFVLGEDAMGGIEDIQRRNMIHIITYDISKPKRLRMVAKICEDYGVRVILENIAFRRAFSNVIFLKTCSWKCGCDSSEYWTRKKTCLFRTGYAKVAPEDQKALAKWCDRSRDLFTSFSLWRPCRVCSTLPIWSRQWRNTREMFLFR